jgi:hypothetical protein
MCVVVGEPMGGKGVTQRGPGRIQATPTIPRHFARHHHSTLCGGVSVCRGGRGHVRKLGVYYGVRCGLDTCVVNKYQGSQ